MESAVTENKPVLVSIENRTENEGVKGQVQREQVKPWLAVEPEKSETDIPASQPCEEQRHRKPEHQEDDHPVDREPVNTRYEKHDASSEEKENISHRMQHEQRVGPAGDAKGVNQQAHHSMSMGPPAPGPAVSTVKAGEGSMVYLVTANQGPISPGAQGQIIQLPKGVSLESLQGKQVPVTQLLSPSAMQQVAVSPEQPAYNQKLTLRQPLGSIGNVQQAQPIHHARQGGGYPPQGAVYIPQALANMTTGQLHHTNQQSVATISFKPLTSTPVQPQSEPRLPQVGRTPVSNLTLNSSGSDGTQSSPDYLPTPRAPYNTPEDSLCPHLSPATLPLGPLSMLHEDSTFNEYDIGKQQHNAKERFRRSRIKKACDVMRSVVPGMTCKTDKATVFEFSAQYILYLKGMVGKEHDREFLRRYSPY